MCSEMISATEKLKDCNTVPPNIICLLYSLLLGVSERITNNLLLVLLHGLWHIDLCTLSRLVLTSKHA